MVFKETPFNLNACRLACAVYCTGLPSPIAFHLPFTYLHLLPEPFWHLEFSSSMEQFNESLDKPDAVKALSQTSLLSQLQSKSSNGVFEWPFVFEVGVMQINRWAFFCI